MSPDILESNPEDPRDSQGETSKLLSPSFFLAITINLCFGMVFFMLLTGMAVYAATEFSVGETAAGFAASAFVVGALLARIMAGKYVDFIGRRRTILVSLVIYVAAGLAYFWVDTYEILILIRIVHGVAFGFGQTALNAGVFTMIPASRRGEGAGYYAVANSLPQALGPLLGLQLSYTFGFWSMFLAATVIASAALLFSLGLQLPEAHRNPQRLWQYLSLKPGDIFERRAFSAAAIGMLISVAFASIITFLDSYSRDEKLNSIAIYYFAIFAALVMMTRLFVGRIQDRYGDNVIFYPSLLMFAAGMVLLAWSPNQLVMLLSAALAGFGYGSLVPGLQAIIASSVPVERLSIGLSTFFILMNTGIGLSPLLLGPVAELGGYRLMYGVCAGVLLVALVAYWLLHGRYHLRQGQPRPT